MRGFFIAAILLSGLSAASMAQPVVTPPPAPAPQTATPAPTPDQLFCSAVARQDSQAGGFDATTQAQIYARSYAQCVAMRAP